MVGVDWLYLTYRRAVAVALCLAGPTILLLVEPTLGGFDAARPIVALGVALFALLPIVVAARSTRAAMTLASVVTLAAAFLVSNASGVVYAFIVTFVIFCWDEVAPARISFLLGVFVLATNEIVNELLEEAHEDGVGWWEVTDVSFVLPAVLEALMISGLVVGLGSALAMTRKQAAVMVGLERANSAMALEAERHRIARDLHDVAAHHLSSITVRTSTAEKLGDSESLQDAVNFAGNTAQKALQAMRQVVTLLRSNQDEVQPGLADLDQLVETSAAAGLEVDLDIDPELFGQLEISTELALWRVVQESLANVMQHSDAGKATVSLSMLEPGVDPLELGEESVRLGIRDPGPASRRPSGGTGFGLIGMRERIEPLGGNVVAGPEGSVGWQVEVVLPVSANSTQGQEQR